MIKNLTMAFAVMILLAGCSPDVKESNITPVVKDSTPVAVTEVSFQEGVDYRIVEGIDIEGAVEPFIVEYFWLGCPHCQALEEPLHQFLAKNPDFSVIKKPAAAMPRWALDAHIYYGLAQVGKLDQLDNLFELYRGKPLPEKEHIATFLTSIEEEPASFFNMISANQQIKQRIATNIAEMQSNKLNGVPSIIVNGKYLVMKSKGDKQFELVRYLSTL